MATDPQRMEWILEQMEGAGNLRYRKMFGEYGVYCDEVFFAVVCDGTLFIKPTQAGRAVLGQPVLQPPHQGAKPSFRLDYLTDRERLIELIRATIGELGRQR